MVIGLFAQVAQEEHWDPGGGIEAHRAHSYYFCLWVPSGAGEEVAGGLQIMRPPPSQEGTPGRPGLPSLDVWPELEGEVSGREDVAHISLLAVRREWRGRGHLSLPSSGLFWPLCAAMWRHCVEEGIREVWLEATPRLLAFYRRVGWPLVVRGELREHWGEPCYPCSLSVREVAGSLAERAVRTITYRRVLADMVRAGSGEFDALTPTGAAEC